MNKTKAQIFFQELFYVLTGALVIFSVLELAWERLVLAYLNLNWVLILWLVCGIVLLIINKKESQEDV